MDLQDSLQLALDRHKPSIVALSEDLIRIASENPPGVYYTECVARIRLELERLGLSHEVLATPGYPDRPRYNLLASHGDGRPTVVFHGHYDVVPAQRRDLFEPRVEQGWLHGRGSADMKAGLASMIYAAYLLKELDIPLPGRVGLCIVADEETGGQGGSRYLEEIGRLGQESIAMLTQEPTGDAIWNANRGAVTLRVTTRGKAAHVGLQHEGINAFEEMLRVASALQGLKAEVEQRRTTYHVTPAEAAHSILMLGGEVQGGTNFNVVPDVCSFTLERRFNPEEDLEVERARLFALFDDMRAQGIRLDVEVLQEGYSCGVPEDHPAAQAVAETAETVTGQRPTFEMCPGILEIRWYARKGIPAFAYGPGRLEVAHGPDEAVELDRVYQHTIIYALAAQRLLHCYAEQPWPIINGRGR
ncbi:MAG: ArgE/DapE family deacylase [Anaerolineae bacterium]